MRKEIEFTKAAKITRGKHYAIGRLYEAETTLELDMNRTNGNYTYIQIHDALLFADKKHSIKSGYVVNVYCVDMANNVITVQNQSRVLNRSTALNEASKFREGVYNFYN